MATDEERARQLALEAAQRAERLAFERGRETAALEARLKDYDQHFTLADRRADRFERGLNTLSEAVAELTEGINRRDAISEALGKSLENAKKGQVTNRTLVMTAVTVIIALGSFMLALSSSLSKTPATVNRAPVVTVTP